MNAGRVVVDANLAFKALALHLDGRLWTDDQQLRSGLQARGFGRRFEP